MVKSGVICKFIVMVGCDGCMCSCDYYIIFVEMFFKDIVILIVGCVKYCYNKLGLGDINGILCVLDVG